MATRNTRIFIANPLQVNQAVTLTPEASHYVARVLRAKPGDKLTLFNGDRHEYHITIDNIDKRLVHATVTNAERIDNESPLHIHLGQAIGKGDKMDWVIQKCTELGVSDITPLFTERCNVKLSGERLDKKHQHWQNIAISAAEQCGRTVVPKVHSPTTTTIWLENLCCQQGFVMHPRNAATLSDMMLNLHDIAVLIGPEGGLTDTEIQHAKDKSFISLQFGNRILRTETAPIVAITCMQSRWGDF